MANKGAIGRQQLEWRRTLDQKWPALRFGEVKVQTNGGQHAFDVQVFLSDLDPRAVRVELCAQGGASGPAVRQEMKNIRKLPGASGGYVYGAAVPGARPPGDYTARIIPNCDGVAVPLEATHILWQR
jgi:starch phosphorylase